jgi:hypothetical protein
MQAKLTFIYYLFTIISFAFTGLGNLAKTMGIILDNYTFHHYI